MPHLRLMLFAPLWAFLIGCSSKPPKLTDLPFPVLILHENSSPMLCAKPDELDSMHVNLVVLSKEFPLLIDSKFAIYRMANLRSTKNGLWLMMNPSGTTPVAFELERISKPNIATAREWILRYSRLSEGSEEYEKMRETLNVRETLEGMANILRKK